MLLSRCWVGIEQIKSWLAALITGNATVDLRRPWQQHNLKIFLWKRSHLTHLQSEFYSTSPISGQSFKFYCIVFTPPQPYSKLRSNTDNCRIESDNIIELRSPFPLAISNFVTSHAVVQFIRLCVIFAAIASSNILRYSKAAPSCDQRSNLSMVVGWLCCFILSVWDNYVLCKIDIAPVWGYFPSIRVFSWRDCHRSCAIFVCFVKILYVLWK